VQGQKTVRRAKVSKYDVVIIGNGGFAGNIFKCVTCDDKTSAILECEEWFDYSYNDIEPFAGIVIDTETDRLIYWETKTRAGFVEEQDDEI
jgi:hypothetical protein